MAVVEIRKLVRDLTNHLQGVLSHTENNDKPEALLAIARCMAELGRITTLVANGFIVDSPEEKAGSFGNGVAETEGASAAKQG